jgi:hypothetical protein
MSLTQSGANTWSVALELNNLASQVASGGGGGGVTSIVATAPLAVSSSSGAVTISNNGILSLAVSGTGLSNTGTAQAPILENTGVLSVGITGTGLSNTGTATAPILENTGVTQILAGAGCTVTNTVGIVTINVTPNLPVQTRAPILLSYSGGPIVLQNASPFTPTTVFTVTLPAAFSGWNVMTMYLNAISVVSTNSSIGTTGFVVYPALTLNEAWNGINNGTVAFRVFDTPNSTTSQQVIALVWNWRPSVTPAGTTFYINVQSTATTFPTSTTTITALSMDIDVIGQQMTLV